MLSRFSAYVLLSLALSRLDAAPLNTLAFGSCNHSHLSQPMWSVIEGHDPDVFLWVGDVIYADTDNISVMKQKYRQQLENTDYRRLRESTEIIGIWDDHDYGDNDVGKNNPIKVASQQLFLDFLQEPRNSPRRKQQGIYTTHQYGEGDQQVKLFMLDTRYHRETPGRGRADLLGDAQWRWLEQQLASTTARVNIIASGFSVLSPAMPFSEEWNDFKWPRKRLFHLIKKHKVSGVLFLVGDRHFSSHLSSRERTGEFHEFMSSGLTHYLRRPFVSAVFKLIYDEKYSYFGKNFSKLEFAWQQEPLRLTFSVFDTDNVRRVRKDLWLRDGVWTQHGDGNE